MKEPARAGSRILRSSSATDDVSTAPISNWASWKVPTRDPDLGFRPYLNPRQRKEPTS